MQRRITGSSSLSSLTFILTHCRNCPPSSLRRRLLPTYPTVSARVIKDRLQWGSDYFSPIPQRMFAAIYNGCKMINLDHHFKLKSNFRGSKSWAATWQQARGIKKQGFSEVKYFLRVQGYNNLGSNRIGQELFILNATPVLQAELKPNTHATAMIKYSSYSVKYG